MRSEPPPSFPWAAGTMRAATTAAEPPEEPPGECSVLQGFRLGPRRRGSVTPMIPSSGVLAWANSTSPAAWKRRTISASSRATYPSSRRVEQVYGWSFQAARRSFSTNGTPESGPPGSGPAARRRASSS